MLDGIREEPQARDLETEILLLSWTGAPQISPPMKETDQLWDLVMQTASIDYFEANKLLCVEELAAVPLANSALRPFSSSTTRALRFSSALAFCTSASSLKNSLACIVRSTICCAVQIFFIFCRRRFRARSDRSAGVFGGAALRAFLTEKMELASAVLNLIQAIQRRAAVKHCVALLQL